MPSLLDKMYEDGKYAAKERQKKNKADARKKKRENEKKKKEAERKKKNFKKKPMSRNERIIYTVLLVIGIPLSVLFFIYYNSSLMQTILLAKGLFKTEQNLGIPTDPDRVPYSKSMSHGVSKDPSNTQSVFDIMDKQNKKVAGVQPPKTQMGGKRKKQRGGNKFNSRLNDAKGFLDTTKFGFPYTWYDNDNFFMRGISDYFITFWTFMRGGLVKLLDVCNETLYKDGYQGHPQDLGGQVFDFVKFTMVLPMLTSILYLGNYAFGTAGLVWSSINNQTLMILPFAILGISLLVIGTISTIATGGLTFFVSNIFAAIAAILILIPLCYFFPYGFFWFYLQAMILKISEPKKKLFRNYLKNYELCWILTIISLLGVSVSYVWDWHIIPKVAFGGVGGIFILLRAMGLF
tara:strand:+ start:923 stop:2137 length:1215 start_codon:yes stop_codon:yes gene_type:complete